MECKKIIVDCDAGVDDALALIMLISAHKRKIIEILAITCVTGNTYVDNVVNNVFRVLHTCNAADIPVYKGADSALLSREGKKGSSGGRYHGSDGFGDVFDDKSDISKLRKEHAACALQQFTAKYYEEVTILCLGPLTNVALTMKIFPDIAKSVKKFIIMGGTLFDKNQESPVDFNFSADPESVSIVFENAPKKLWLLPKTTCLKSTISYQWRDNVFGTIVSPAVKLLNAIETEINIIKKKTVSNYTPCDAFAAGILLRSDIAKIIEALCVHIDLDDSSTKGFLFVDSTKSLEPNVHVIQDVDSEIFKELLLSAVDSEIHKTAI